MKNKNHSCEDKVNWRIEIEEKQKEVLEIEEEITRFSDFIGLTYTVSKTFLFLF